MEKIQKVRYLNYVRKRSLQKRATRIILDMPPDASSMPLFEKLGLLTVRERLEYNKAIVKPKFEWFP